MVPQQLIYDANPMDQEAREPDGLNWNSDVGKLIGSEMLSGGVGGVSSQRPTERNSGPWGASAYGPMYGLVTELLRRQFKLSVALTEHGEPMVVLTKDENYEHHGFSDPERPDIEVYAEKIAVKNWRRRHIAMLPERYKSADYLSIDPQMQAFFGSMEHSMKSLAAISPMMPLALGMHHGAKSLRRRRRRGSTSSARSRS